MSYRRKQVERRKLRKLAKNRTGWRGGAYYDEEKKRYIRYWMSKRNHLTGYWKKQCNKQVRRADNLFGKGNSYRKCAEYRWKFW